ncbi:MAG TPA: zinc ribbon domain-containing protein [Candidatus Butyricimonas faecavium]|mgnify:CR=1|nr:zinc ribbon domain-containing protein [Candidatus Butyricimonas faecavium]
MEYKFYQNCGMPMMLEKQYYSYCYHDGVFTEDCTMDEMIEHC